MPISDSKTTAYSTRTYNGVKQWYVGGKWTSVDPYAQSVPGNTQGSSGHDGPDPAEQGSGYTGGGGIRGSGLFRANEVYAGYRVMKPTKASTPATRKR